MSISTQHARNTHYTSQVLSNVSGTCNATRTVRKWHYLLSDTLRFSDTQTNGIRIQKPITELVFDYCVKIVSHQQVDTLYIEQHRFTASELFNLTMLCKNKQVNLVHLTKAPYEQSNNIIYGPW